MRFQFTVIIARLGTMAGGEATLTDFAAAAVQDGATVCVLVGRSTLRQRTILRRHLLRFMPTARRKLRVIPSARVIDFKASRSVDLSDFAGWPKLPATALRFLLDPRRVRSERALKASDRIIVSQALTDRGVEQLKAHAAVAQLYYYHNGDPDSFFANWAGSRFPDRTIGIRQYSAFLESFDFLIFQSPAQEHLFQQMFPGGRYESLSIWPSCSEALALASASEASPFASDVTNLVCVAKFQASKRQLELIEAVAAIVDSFPQMRLTFVGGRSSDSHYLEMCIEEVKRKGLSDKIMFAGPRNDALSFIAHCDFFILVSLSEGVSRALREAAFLGKTIICSALAGSVDFLTRDGAYFIESQDPEEISRTIALAIDEKRMSREIGRRARRAYVSKASWPAFRTAVRALMTH